MPASTFLKITDLIAATAFVDSVLFVRSSDDDPEDLLIETMYRSNDRHLGFRVLRFVFAVRICDLKNTISTWL